MDSRNVALVTAASRGFGRALTEVLLGRCWTVIGLVRDESAAHSLANAEPGHCFPVLGDVTANDVVDRISSALQNGGGRLDLLVNNAGTGGVANIIETVEPHELSRLFEVHCLGALRCTKAALPYLLASRARIVVNMSSRVGSLRRNAGGEFAGRGFSYSYRIAKAAQNMLTLCLAQELGARGVSVCAVHPGKLLTDSASVDADTSPFEAAARFAKWLDAAGPWVSGLYFDLEAGKEPW